MKLGVDTSRSIGFIRLLSGAHTASAARQLGHCSLDLKHSEPHRLVRAGPFVSEARFNNLGEMLCLLFGFCSLTIEFLKEEKRRRRSLGRHLFREIELMSQRTLADLRFK